MPLIPKYILVYTFLFHLFESNPCLFKFFILKMWNYEQRKGMKMLHLQRNTVSSNDLLVSINCVTPFAYYFQKKNACKFKLRIIRVCCCTNESEIPSIIYCTNCTIEMDYYFNIKYIAILCERFPTIKQFE